MNPRLQLLHPYPFEKLRLLFGGIEPKGKAINMGIGEPQHPTPSVVLDALTANLDALGKYPPTAGTPGLRGAISEWIGRRYGIPEPNPDRQILPVSGSREALFGFAQAVLDGPDAVVLLPNPFYQIYEGAAIMAGAQPVYVPTPREKQYKPDWSTVPAGVWPRVQLAYVCTPGNPAGAVLDLEDWREILELAERHDFLIASDEPYSELYQDDALIGVLQAVHQLGFGADRVVAFNSLSKRSSAPGLRSGFVAGAEDVIQKFLLYRTYHGAAPSLAVQAASEAAWRDEEHVRDNRILYREKFAEVTPIINQVLPCEIPEGGFFLWARVPEDSRWKGDDEAFARDLYAAANVTVLPGSYLAREVDGFNPGKGHVRIALVAPLETCLAAAQAIGSIA